MSLGRNNQLTMGSFFPSILLASCLLPVLGGCATATRGSKTYFVVETLPIGAKVYTDKQKIFDQKKASGSTSEFYGCAATPCEITMSRRSQFNVMVTKEGYAPFFYVVQKRPHKELKKDKEDREAFRLDTNGDIIPSDELSANAGILPTDNPPLSAAAGTAVGAWYAGESMVFMATASTVTAATVVMVASPILITGYGLDLTSGALIDLTPNPMVVKLAPEESADETQRLKSAFMASRDKKAGR